jgi:S-adenosyl-L-methionine hydrolase (adenosine-forming)
MPIALLTDFGTRDYFVAAMKGAIVSINPAVAIVDITHEVPPQDIGEGAFTLRACCRDFPKGTIFVAVVDPGVGSERRGIIADADGYYFVAPDNGVLSFIFGDGCEVREITEERFFRRPVSNTFHGRDIFVPVAAYLSLGLPANAFGNEIFDPVTIEGARPLIAAGRIEGEVIHIDRFGNLVTNITSGDLPASYNIEIDDRIIEKRYKYYAEATEGEIFPVIGSAGFMEISVRNGSAAAKLRAKVGSAVNLSKT